MTPQEQEELNRLRKDKQRADDERWCQMHTAIGNLKDQVSGVGAQVKDLSTDTAIIKKVLLGNGEPEKGMVVRFDRVEQLQSVYSKLTWILATSFVGALITGAFLWLRK